MYYKFSIIISLISMISAIDIPTTFKSETDAIKNIITPKFFKLRIKHLNITNYKININLDDNIDIKNIDYPIKLVYSKIHNLYQIPDALSPRIKTTELWNYDLECITGDIETSLVKLKLTIKPIQKELVYIQIIPQIVSKKFFIPYSNKIIENNVSLQCNDMFNKILEDLGYKKNELNNKDSIHLKKLN